MARIITFSLKFPAYHPKIGQPTFFVEKMLNDLGTDYTTVQYYGMLSVWNEEKLKDGRLSILDLQEFFISLRVDVMECKAHTIRSGNRFKAGDTFAPCVWTDKVNPKSGRKGAYQSPQIQFAPNIEVKKTWDTTIQGGLMWVNHQGIVTSDVERVAINDGLSYIDFRSWFYGKEFSGTIICWNDKIEY